MTPPETDLPTVLKVIDAFDHPHGNRILRTRILRGGPPTMAELKGSRLLARGPDGLETDLRVLGFPLFGGTPSDARIRSTGRVDLLVTGADDLTTVAAMWELHPTHD